MSMSGESASEKEEKSIAQVYSELVATGDSYFEAGFYEKAASTYLKASKIKFVDYPNYGLFAKLAHTYLLKNQIDVAEYFINKSEMVLSVLVGIYSCEENDQGSKPVFFISRDGRSSIDSPLNSEVANLMCGGAYDYYYNNRNKTLTGIVSDGRLVDYHLKVRELIKQRYILLEKEG